MQDSQEAETSTVKVQRVNKRNKKVPVKASHFLFSRTSRPALGLTGTSYSVSLYFPGGKAAGA